MATTGDVYSSWAPILTFGVSIDFRLWRTVIYSLYLWNNLLTIYIINAYLPFICCNRITLNVNFNFFWLDEKIENYKSILTHKSQKQKIDTVYNDY